jgi:hypothetical protein
MNVTFSLLMLLAGSSYGSFSHLLDIDATSYKEQFRTPVQLHVGDDAPITYGEIKLQAIFNCKNRDPSKVNIGIIDKLIQVEKKFNVPSEMRGMVLAAACMESGYNPFAKGDHKFSKNKKTPMAIGILQQWKVYEKAYGTNRTDPESAAMGWMQHIVRQLPKVKKRCKFKTTKRVWIAAWVHGVRAPKDGGRCKEVPLHYRILKKWHKQIRKERIEDIEVGPLPDAKDGC